MKTYTAFLRGINVGAHNRMKMAELRELCEGLNWENVQTYIASGNVVFESTEAEIGVLEDKLAEAITEEFGYDITVMVRTQDELNDIVENIPFEASMDEDVKLYVAFLATEPNEEQRQELLDAAKPAEEFVVEGREVYSHVDTGRIENGKFTDAGNLLGLTATRRSWDVVTRVLALGQPEKT